MQKRLKLFNCPPNVLYTLGFLSGLNLVLKPGCYDCYVTFYNTSTLVNFPIRKVKNAWLKECQDFFFSLLGAGSLLQSWLGTVLFAFKLLFSLLFVVWILARNHILNRFWKGIFRTGIISVLLFRISGALPLSSKSFFQPY